MAGQTPALQQNLQSSEKSQHFKKNTIFNEHPVCMNGIYVYMNYVEYIIKNQIICISNFKLSLFDRFIVPESRL